MIKLIDMPFDVKEFLKGIHEDEREKVVRHMLDENIPISTITLATGFTEEEINEINGKMSMREIYLKALENLSPDSEFTKYMKREIDTMVELTEMQFDEEEFLKGIREDGVEEGKEEVVCRMLDENMPINTIMLATGFTKEKVLKIASERSK